MSSDKITLKDLAKELGVSTATVHRALHGKAGVGGKAAAEIKQFAACKGYQANYMASALKRKKLQFAVVFPEPIHDNRYYYRALWAGTRHFFTEVREFNPEVHEIAYPIAPGSHGAALHALWEAHRGDLDGIVTLALDDAQTAAALELFATDGVPITLVGADLYAGARLCCVKAYDEAAGSLAAELLTGFHDTDFSRQIILTGNPVGCLSMRDQFHNLYGFEAYIRANRPGVQLLSAYNSDAQLSCHQIRLLLEHNPHVYAIYSASARHSVRVAHLLSDMGLAGSIKLVGNDVFPESTALLQQGIITAIIDKKVQTQSYEAARLLFHFAVKKEVPTQSIVSIRPDIVMKSNFFPTSLHYDSGFFRMPKAPL